MGEGAAPGSWESLYRFRQEVDDLLEAEQEAGRDLPEVLRALQGHWIARVGAQGSRIEIFGDGEEQAVTFDTGEVPGDLPVGVDAGWSPDGRAHRSTFDVREEVLGTAVVFFFGDGDPPLGREWVERYGEAFVEQVDNHVYQLREARRQHRLAVRIQKCLETAVFEDGLDEAVEVLMEHLPVSSFLLLYRSTHALYPERIVYRAYEASGRVVLDNVEKRDASLEAALDGVDLSTVAVASLPGELPRGNEAPVELPLVRRGRHEELLGKMVVWLEDGAPRAQATATTEILSACVMQRLADYSRETRDLQRYFSPRVVGRLLRTPGYQSELLAPRVEEVGILFIDVAGFTSLSEQILVEPDAIGRFVDLWVDEAARVLLRRGGVLDKIIGDCLLGLVGPPFFEEEPFERGLVALRAALEIQEVTRELTDHPDLAPYRRRIVDAKGGLDVSTGVHLASVAVGTFGSNQDYTAFGSGMNNTARLQSLAAPGQTLVHGDLADALREHPEACVGFRFGDEGATPVKNVAEPLRWVEVVPDAK